MSIRPFTVAALTTGAVTTGILGSIPTGSANAAAKTPHGRTLAAWCWVDPVTVTVDGRPVASTPRIGPVPCP